MAVQHRCWGCGMEVEVCGSLCTDCSWEAHLAYLAHTAEYEEPKKGTPACCRDTFHRQKAEI